jgi:hypothetical protein
VVPDFYAFGEDTRGGVTVAAGDVTGDGRADLVFGAGPGGPPRVLVRDGRSLAAGQTTPVANFVSGDAADTGGVRVATRDLDGDFRADLVVGAGFGAAPVVRTYLAKDLTLSGTPPVFGTQTVLDTSFLGGVFVG